MMSASPRPVAFRLFHLMLVVLTVATCAETLAQNKDEGPLYMRTPFDRIVMKSGQKVNVQKLRLPWGGRTVPATLPAAGTFKARLLEGPNTLSEYDISWSQVARIDLFEDMIMQEGVQLTKDKKFDDAFPYFAYLLKEAPQTRGLDQAISTYLQTNALAAYDQHEFDRALAILGSLYERTPNSRGLSGAVDTVASKIIEQYLAEKNYKAARLTLDVVDHTFRGLDIKVVNQWRGNFKQTASSQLKEAERLINARQYLEARQAIAEAVGVWPEQPGIVEMQERLQREHPIVTLGVLQRSPSKPTHRLDSFASTRAASLIAPTLVELRGYTSEGGEYVSSVGQVELSDTGQELTVQFVDAPSGNPVETGLAASAFARKLIEVTNPASDEYDEALGTVIVEVSVEYPNLVHIKLSHSHVRPEALLTLPMSPAVGQLSDRGIFSISEQNNELTRFVADPDHRGAIAELHEVAFADDEDLVTAVSLGTVDVIDRVPPWQLPRLRANKQVVIGTYKLPTIHVLIPTGRSPITSQREFRRALCYGIDNETIIRDVLLAGNDVPGFQPVSGPFPAGLNTVDPIRYGYNGQVKPRKYDPYMAIVLSSAAWSNVQKSQGIKEPNPDTPLPKLKLGHSSDAVARTACNEIVKYLEPLGISVELVELSTEEMLMADDLVDLKYVELETWEPVVDARRLLGANGLLGEASDYMMLSLDRLDQAENWNQVRNELFNIHDVASTDLPVIPLWQTVNYFAYRSALTGISAEPVHLFQDVAKWQLEIRPQR
ncbi:ABC transporter substrate-binding protein [Aeoliella mucimassa]|nr:ABC transporter substrate-binding protein [Aeoliella mucimassa]